MIPVLGTKVFGITVLGTWVFGISVLGIWVFGISVLRDEQVLTAYAAHVIIIVVRYAVYNYR